MLLADRVNDLLSHGLQIEVNGLVLRVNRRIGKPMPDDFPRPAQQALRHPSESHPRPFVHERESLRRIRSRSDDECHRSIVLQHFGAANIPTLLCHSIKNFVLILQAHCRFVST